MKITFISDTHTKHGDIYLDSGDVLVHCGDITSNGDIKDVISFAKFIKDQDFLYKVVIAGNHDFCFEDERSTLVEDILKENGIIYLNDSGVTINGINFWGSPIQPEFCSWAFNRRRGEEISRHWDLIPSNTDILITHGPPFGILDRCTDGGTVGCKDLLKKINSLNIKIHAFGHIHESYGSIIKNGTRFINASILDEMYAVQNPPITFNI